MTRAIALGVAMLALAACSPSEVSATTGPPINASQDELHEVVQIASQKVLDAPGFTATSVTRDRLGTPMRSTWLDYRTNGDYFLAVAVPHNGVDSLVPVAIGALVRVGEHDYEATRQTADSEPWSQQRGNDQADLVPIDPDLGDYAAGVRITDPRSDSATITMQQMDGWVSWTVEEVLENGRTTQEWQIDADGLLQAHTFVWDGDTEGFATVTSFAERTDPEPISAPEIGAPLDIASYGVPQLLPEVQQ